MWVIEIVIEDHVVHELDRQLLEEAAEVGPEFGLRRFGLKCQHDVLGADREAPPGAQFAGSHRGGNFVGGLDFELERPEACGARQPLPYLEFLHINMNARLIMTDSGGLQEESTVLGVPCLTLRDNTERPITCTEGTNRVIGNDGAKIVNNVRQVLTEDMPTGRVPEFWDGRAAERIVEVLRNVSVIS